MSGQEIRGSTATAGRADETDPETRQAALRTLARMAARSGADAEEFGEVARSLGLLGEG